MKIDNYEDLIGKFINKVEENEDYVYFITNDNLTIRMPKFEPYCACYVGEYINEITQDGTCCGVITNIETNIKGNQKKNGMMKNTKLFIKEMLLFTLQMGN